MNTYSTNKQAANELAVFNPTKNEDHNNLLKKYPTFHAIIKEIKNNAKKFSEYKTDGAGKMFLEEAEKLDRMADKTLIKLFSSKGPSSYMEFFSLKDLKVQEIRNAEREFFYNYSSKEV